MNNTDFRAFVSSTPRVHSSSHASTTPKPSSSRSFMPAKSRQSLTSRPSKNDFASQLVEQQKKAVEKQRKSRNPISRPAPFKPPPVIQDDSKQRILALEEQLNLGRISREMFDQMRQAITSDTKGQLHPLLRPQDPVKEEQEERIGTEIESGDDDRDRDLDEGLDELEKLEVAPVLHEKTEKRGQRGVVAGQKRSRADLLAEMQKQRQARAEEEVKKMESKLGANFRRVKESRAGVESWIEHDAKGREVLITVDEEGNVKRKVRKIKDPVKSTGDGEQGSSGPVMLADAAVEAPAPEAAGIEEKAEVEDEVADIFADAGTDYDPLAALRAQHADSDSSSSPSSDEQPAKKTPAQPPNASTSKPTDRQENKQRDYFQDTDGIAKTTSKVKDIHAQNAEVLATLKRAADREEARAAEPQSATAKRLLARDRDMDDIDMGFGGSRFGDEEEDEDEDGRGGARVKLSRWKGMRAAGNGDDGGGDDDDGGDGDGDGGGKQRGKGATQRKRGGRKKKGDKNSATDVLKAMERQKK